MRSRTPGSAFLAAALLWGALVAVPSSAVAADVRNNAKNQGKVGDRCANTNDCQQTPAALSCQPVGEQKQCQAPAPRPYVHKVT